MTAPPTRCGIPHSRDGKWPQSRRLVSGGSERAADTVLTLDGWLHGQRCERCAALHVPTCAARTFFARAGWLRVAVLFLTEELARHGYIVAAPDHKDDVCAIGSDEHHFGNMRTDQSFLEPDRWSERSQRDRLRDLRAVIDLVANDPQLGPAADVRSIGVIGHSLGGYAAIGMAGGWPSWKHADVKAVLALSPYVLPFIKQGTLARLDVPVMYQGGQFDWGITTSLEGTQGAYAVTAPPKYFVKLKGGTHLEWINLLCSGQPNVVACLKAKPNAYLIDRYGIEFLDRHLKNKPSALLDGKGTGLDLYRFELP